MIPFKCSLFYCFHLLLLIQTTVDTIHGCMEITATISRIGNLATRVILIITIKVVRAIMVVSSRTTRDNNSNHSNKHNSNTQITVAIDSSHISSDPISRILDTMQVVSIVISHQIVAATGANFAKTLLFFSIQFPCYTTFPLMRTQKIKKSAKVNDRQEKINSILH